MFVFSLFYGAKSDPTKDKKVFFLIKLYKNNFGWIEDCVVSWLGSYLCFTAEFTKFLVHQRKTSRTELLIIQLNLILIFPGEQSVFTEEKNLIQRKVKGVQNLHWDKAGWTKPEKILKFANNKAKNFVVTPNCAGKFVKPKKYYITNKFNNKT